MAPVRSPILLLEDDRIDAMTIQRALRELHVTDPLVLAEDGEEALDYLRNPDNPRPHLVLLDLNMPRMNGIEFLHVVKKDEVLRQLPAVVLTTSDQDQDKVNSFKLGAAGYMLKPVDYRRFVETMRTINSYWTLSRLPP